MFCLRTVGENEESQRDVNRRLRDGNGDVWRVSSICRVDLEEGIRMRAYGVKERERKEKKTLDKVNKGECDRDGRKAATRPRWLGIGRVPEKPVAWPLSRRKPTRNLGVGCVLVGTRLPVSVPSFLFFLIGSRELLVVPSVQ
jgi:hypothetical protein